ncbi:P-loop containing nucleoside triphosphate hydrolase protein, partial [Massariosphaeria phaeospora]
KGLIMLLHGAPGVGKTCTAECVAAKHGRPLFPITCGDLGTTPTEVETNLDFNFQLAESWGCVLLLDEADVFLAEKRRKDVNQNALVSVFLCALEYYRGILFLTTNRVGTIDEAFRSRIHLTLYYPPLDMDKTEAIWKHHLNRLDLHERKPVSGDRDDILEYAKQLFNRQSTVDKVVWNGRQIRNAFQTAVALA